MTFPEIKLVDSPSASATVLFDFNDITATPKREVEADDFTIGTPGLEGDVDAIDPLYSERIVSFTCAITGTKPQVAATQSALARRLLAPGQTWLWVRMGPTSRLLFFRMYRPQPGDLSFELVQSVSTTRSERWLLEVTLPCEPFAYGERVTQVAQTVSSDPTAGTNPLQVTLPAISGDVAAPLDVTVMLSTAPSARNAVTVMSRATATAKTVVNLPIGTGDGATVGPDTGAGVANSAYVGGSYREITFATLATLTGRAFLPTTGKGLAVGRYRAFVRAASSDAASTYQLTLGDAVTMPTSTLQPNGTGPTWVDLGIFTTNANIARSPNGPNPVPPDNLSLAASRTAGTGSLRLDHVMLVPLEMKDSVDFRLMRATTAKSMTPGTLYLDGTYDEVATDAPSWGSIEAVGVFPAGLPNAVNVLNFTFSSAPFAADSVTRTASVVVSYYPRFLYLGDS